MVVRPCWVLLGDAGFLSLLVSSASRWRGWRLLVLVAAELFYSRHLLPKLLWDAYCSINAQQDSSPSPTSTPAVRKNADPLSLSRTTKAGPTTAEPWAEGLKHGKPTRVLSEPTPCEVLVDPIKRRSSANTRNMYTYVCVYTYTCIDIDIHIDIPLYIHIHACTHVYTHPCISL